MAKRDFAVMLGMSALSGTRTFAGPALISNVKGTRYNRSSITNFLRSRQAGRWLPIIAAGEIVSDKFPVPNRVSAPSLIARAASGAVVALALVPNRSRNRTRVLAAGLGALAAVAAAEGTFHLRRLAHERLQVPSPILGAVEDLCTLAAGRTLLRVA